MVNFPDSLDTLSNPNADTLLDAAGLEHDVQHANLNDIVEALEAKLGISLSTDVNSVDYLLKLLGQAITPADAFDDEFRGGSLDEKWAWTNQSTASSLLGKSHLALTFPASTTDQCRQLIQAISGSTWRIEACCSLLWNYNEANAATSYLYGGLCAREAASGKIVTFGLNWRAGTFYVYGHKWTNDTTISAALFTAVAIPNNQYYLSLERTATSLVGQISLDGDIWQTVFTETLVASLGFTAGPDYAGFWGTAFKSGTATTPVTAIFDYLRKVA